MILGKIHVELIFIPTIKAQSSEQAAVEQEKVQNQLEEISVKLNEVANAKEPVVAFRGTGVKDSGSHNTVSVHKDGKFCIILAFVKLAIWT